MLMVSMLQDFINLDNESTIESLNLSQLLRKLLINGYNISKATACDECDWIIQEFAQEYAQKYHGYLAITICFFGTIANTLNIAVLTRKDMACTPINRILMGLAVADMILMIEYMTFAYYYHVELMEKLNFPYWGAAFVLFHTHFAQVLHTISICLTLTLAMWRYMAIRYPERNRILCSEKRCTLAICLSYILPIFLCAPTFFVLEIHATVVVEDEKEFILYHTSLSKSASNSDLYLIFNFWMYAVVIKLLPCFILTIISVWLIRTLFKAKRRKALLRSTNNMVNVPKMRADSRRTDRTTRMLVAVLLLFLLTEFPQGIFGLLIGMRGQCFFLKCYQIFGELMDMLALLNGSINFILYCSMNRMFRATFGKIFRNKIMDKLAHVPLTEMHTTPLGQESVHKTEL